MEKIHVGEITMSWKDIIKTYTNIQKFNPSGFAQDLKELAEELEGLTLEEGNKVDWETFVSFDTNLEQNEMFQHRRDLKKLIENVWDAKDAYNMAIESLSDTLKEEGERERRGEYRPLRDNVGIAPEFRGYKLKDNEQWGVDADSGLLVPKPIDDQYGAEW
mgnify:CR=1 FL=1